jgi:hypothetical protein
MHQGFTRCHPRAVLTVQQAIEIYQSPRLIGNVAMQAQKYNVSPKTIRDILNRRTWARETRHLWAQGEQSSIRAPKVKTTRSHAPVDYEQVTVRKILAGEQFTDQPSNDQVSYSSFLSNEIMDLNQTDHQSSTSVQGASSKPIYPMKFQPASPSENIIHRHQPNTQQVALHQPLFVPEASHLGTSQPGISDDPFHFDWPNW